MIDFVIGHAGDTFGPYVAKKLGCKFRSFRSEYYPEGTPAPCIEAEYDEIEGSHVLTVRRSGQIPNRDGTCRLLLNYPRVARSLSDPETFNAARVDVFHPYFLLGKQDHNPRTDKNPRIKREDKGKDQGYKFEAGLFRGCSRLITFHPHFHREPGETDEEGVHIVCLDAIPAMIDYAEKMGISKDCIVLSPDFSGGTGEAEEYIMARDFAGRTGYEFGYLKSKRQGPSEKTGALFDAHGRDVLMVDDSAITLSTLYTGVNSIVNANNIDVLVAHAVLPKEGYEKVRMLTRGGGPLRSFAGTDSVNSDFSDMSIVDELVKSLKENGK